MGTGAVDVAVVGVVAAADADGHYGAGIVVQPTQVKELGAGCADFVVCS